jgi:hypothetical protein
MKIILHALTALAFYAFACQALRGDEILTYVGPSFTNCGSGSAPACNDNLDNIDIVLDLLTPLGDKLTGANVNSDVFSFTMSDGNSGDTATLINSTSYKFDFVTDALGVVSGWEVFASNGGGLMYTQFNDGSETGSETNVDGVWSNLNSLATGTGGYDASAPADGPADWTQGGSTATPEPAWVSAILIAGCIGWEIFKRYKARARGAGNPEDPDEEEDQDPSFAKQDTSALEAILRYQFLVDNGFRQAGRGWFHVTDLPEKMDAGGWSTADAVSIARNRLALAATGSLNSLAVALARTPAPGVPSVPFGPDPAPRAPLDQDGMLIA